MSGARTTLVIAHRLSTVRDADVVMVMDGGLLVGQGPHEELMRSSTLYANLVQRQLVEDSRPGEGQPGAEPGPQPEAKQEPSSSAGAVAITVQPDVDEGA